jgi:hypothetical protein
MSPRVLCCALWACALLGCDRKPDSAPSAPPTPAPAASPAATALASTALATASGAPVATAPAASASGSAVSAGAKNKLCERVLTAADVKSACSVDPSLDPSAAPDELETQATFTCTRRFSLAGRSLTFLLSRGADAKQARQIFDDQGKSRKEEPEFKALSGVGDAARRFVSITLTGDLNHTIEVIKGPLTLKAFTPKVTSNNRDLAPFCTLDQLEALGKLAASRM